MSDRTESYNKATEAVLANARKIDLSVSAKFEYSLEQMVTVLRDLYKNKKFRNKFIDKDIFKDEYVYPSKGFCALSSVCIYELYGGSGVWELQAIKLGTWEHAPVVFLRDKLNWTAFDTTGDQFAPLIVPYQLGQPVNKKLNPTKKTEFIKLVKRELDSHAA
ncbi:MAG: hypothetical protein LBF37_00660 [Rickettsiales bacterium]|jgi:hypothetical protein|nr:hypothetical protein [Rickettsiales bacterium]